jgi:hypothetical protein
MQTNTTLVLNPAPLPDVFGNNIGSARIAFKNLHFTDVRNDVCSNINTPGYYFSDLPNQMIGLTVSNEPNETMKVRDIGLYNYVNGKMTLDTSDPTPIYERLYEDVIITGKPTRRQLQPRAAVATIHKFIPDVCGYQKLQYTVSGVFSLKDFGISNMDIPAPVSTETPLPPTPPSTLLTTSGIKSAIPPPPPPPPPTYEMIQQMKVQRDKSNQELIQVTADRDKAILNLDQANVSKNQAIENQKKALSLIQSAEQEKQLTIKNKENENILLNKLYLSRDEMTKARATAVDDLQKIVNTTNDMIKSRAAAKAKDLPAIDKKIDAAKKDIDVRTTAINTIDTKLAAILQDIATKQQVLPELDTKIASLTKDIELKNQQYPAYTTQINSITQDIINKQAILTQLNLDVTKKTTEFKTTSDTVKNYENSRVGIIYNQTRSVIDKELKYKRTPNAGEGNGIVPELVSMNSIIYVYVPIQQIITPPPPALIETPVFIPPPSLAPAPVPAPVPVSATATAPALVTVPTPTPTPTPTLVTVPTPTPTPTSAPPSAP